MVLRKDDDDNQSITSFASANSGKGIDQVVHKTNETQTKRTVLLYSEKNNILYRQNDFSNLSQELTNSSNELENNFLDIHCMAFNNDLNGLKLLVNKLRKQNFKNLNDYISTQDRHGNTPLHLACMLGYFEVAKFLIDSGAVVKSRNKQMWTPLNEAISFGNRDLSKIGILDQIKVFISIDKGAIAQVQIL